MLANEKLTGLVWLDQRDHPLCDNTLVEPVAKRYACRNGSRVLVSNVHASNHGYHFVLELASSSSPIAT
jgi:hypothetical protein